VPSYSPVFSAPFVQYTPAAPNYDYLVPEGFTAVIRQISAAQDAGGWIFFVQIADSEVAPPLTIFVAEQLGVINYVAGTGRWVVPGGGVISTGFTSVGTNPFIYVGGYLLRDTLT